MTFVITTALLKPWDGCVEVEGGYFIMYFTSESNFNTMPLKPTSTYSIHPRYTPAPPTSYGVTYVQRDQTAKRYLRAYGSDGMYICWVSDDPIYADPYFDAFVGGYDRQDALYELIHMKDYVPTNNPPTGEFIVKSCGNGKFILPGTKDNTYECYDTVTPTPANVTYIVPRFRFQSNSPLDSFYIRSFNAYCLYRTIFNTVFTHCKLTTQSRWTLREVPPPAGSPPADFVTVNFFNVNSSCFLGIDAGGAITMTSNHLTTPNNVINFRIVNSRTAFSTIYPGTNLLFAIHHPFSNRFLVSNAVPDLPVLAVPTTHASFDGQRACWEFQPAVYTDVNARQVPPLIGVVEIVI